MPSAESVKAYVDANAGSLHYAFLRNDIQGDAGTVTSLDVSSAGTVDFSVPLSNSAIPLSGLIANDKLGLTISGNQVVVQQSGRYENSV